VFNKIKKFRLKSVVLIGTSAETNNVFNRYIINVTVMYLRKMCS